MQKTANQIKSSFETLASGHYQIHSFLYAQEFEQQAYENLIYPLMLVYPLGGNLSGTTYSRNYRVIIADRVLKSEGNELEVESDTQLIALDVLAYWMKLGQNERFTITSSNTITPFWEKWGDEVTGHFVDIGIEEFYDFNSCAIPLSGSIPTPPNPCKDARISVNSVVYGNAPSDSNFNVVVKDQDGDLVGSLIGGEWIVNTGGSCADATYTIEDTLGNVLYTGTIPSGGSLTQAIGDSTATLRDTNGLLISTTSILAEGSDDIVAPDGQVTINGAAFDSVVSNGTLDIDVLQSSGNTPIGSKQGTNYRINDSVAVIKDSANNTLKSENILAEATENISISDSVAVIKDSASLTLKTENILAEATENIVINDSLVNVRKSDNVLISAVSVKAENTENYLVGDSLIENDATTPTYSQLVKATESLILPTQEIQNNGVASGFIPSVGTINVTTNAVPTSFTITGRTIDIVVPSGSSPSGVDFRGFPHSTQRLSYRTGDIGWRTQNAWYDYVPPTTPKAVADLDYSSANFWYLMKNNLVVDGQSSKTRFVDVDGVQTFSATANKNLILVDKFTGLGIYRGNLASTYTWNAAIDAANSLSIVVDGVTYDEWYLISVEEWVKIVYGRGNNGAMTDAVTSVNVLNMAAATFILSDTWSSDTFYRRSWRDDSGNNVVSTAFANSGGFYALFITKQTMNLITAP